MDSNHGPSALSHADALTTELREPGEVPRDGIEPPTVELAPHSSTAELPRREMVQGAGVEPATSSTAKSKRSAVELPLQDVAVCQSVIPRQSAAAVRRTLANVVGTGGLAPPTPPVNRPLELRAASPLMVHSAGIEPATSEGITLGAPPLVPGMHEGPLDPEP